MWWGPAVAGRDAAGAGADGNTDGDGDTEWLTRRYEAGERRPARFFVEVGNLETTPLPFAGGPDLVSATRRFAVVLRQRGYEVVGYGEPPGGHDLVHWTAVLPTALEALLGNGS